MKGIVVTAILGTLHVLGILQAVVSTDSKSKTQNNRFKVRAVLVRCDNKHESLLNDMSTSDVLPTFEKEELYRHNVVRDCHKKIILTMRLRGDANDYGEEYVPIDHVYDPFSKSNVQLLNPYVVKLRQEPVLQAYNLTFLQTVATAEDSRMNNLDHNIINRQKREAFWEGRVINNKHRSFSVKVDETPLDVPEVNVALTDTTENPRDCGIEVCNITDSHQGMTTVRSTKHRPVHHKPAHPHSHTTTDTTHVFPGNSPKRLKRQYENIAALTGEGNSSLHPDVITATHNERRSEDGLDVNSDDAGEHVENKLYNAYNIGEPALWYSVHIQLFEKQCTPEGDTVWSDVTKGVPVSIGTFQPTMTDASSGASVSARYSPEDYLKEDHYVLPAPNKLVLLVPQSNNWQEDSFKKDLRRSANELLVAPAADVVNSDISSEHHSQHGWVRSANKIFKVSEPGEELKHLVIRNAKPLRSLYDEGGASGGSGTQHALVSRGEEHYLALRHRRSHHALIDLEARADDNEIVRVGSSARVSTVTVDSSRAKRSIITVQIANTGLAAAQFHAVLWDCPAAIMDMMSAASTPPVLIPPRHTRKVQVELTGHLPSETAQCSVGIQNDKEDLAAIRHFIIKRKDRCFCVWHCNCVCIGQKPDLPCEPLPSEQLAAAGFVPGDAPRRPRFACYTDNRALDVLLLFVGLLVFLLALGLLKGIVGLVWPRAGAWGLERLVELPRQMERYYEPWLRHRPVVYDCAGWPVHPDTKRRSVRVMSLATEFCLNSVFFLTFPCAVTWTALFVLGGLVCPCWAERVKPSATAPCYAWTQRVEVQQQRNYDDTKHLLTERLDDFYADDTAEESDTKYVLMHMQKSKESLARSQMKRTDISGGNSPGESCGCDSRDKSKRRP